MDTTIISMDRENGIDFMSDQMWQCSNKDIVALVCADDQIIFIPMSPGGRMTLYNRMEEIDVESFSEWEFEMSDYEAECEEWEWN